MKSIRCASVIFSALFAVSGIMYAGQSGASKENGKILFNDPRLGTTGKSCNDCHPNGKGAARAASKSDHEIGRIVNVCITNSIRGAALDESSVKMQSLGLYIKSLAGRNDSSQPNKNTGC